MLGAHRHSHLARHVHGNMPATTGVVIMHPSTADTQSSLTYFQFDDDVVAAKTDAASLGLSVNVGRILDIIQAVPLHERVGVPIEFVRVRTLHSMTSPFPQTVHSMAHPVPNIPTQTLTLQLKSRMLFMPLSIYSTVTFGETLCASVISL